MTDVYRGCTSRFCTVCGGLLPCERCAREYRRAHGLVGKEPDGGGEEGLDPLVETRAREVREVGFVDEDGDFHEPWSEQEYERRAGLAAGPLELEPVKISTQSQHRMHDGER